MGFWAALFSLGTTPPRQRILRQPLTTSYVRDSNALHHSSTGIDYRLERGRRKSIGLIITTEGLLIRAPKWTSRHEIDAAITERRSWITSALEQQSTRLGQLAAYHDGGHVLFRGKKLQVELRSGLFESVDLTENHCIITTASGTFNVAALDNEIKAIAQHELPQIAKNMARQADLPLKSVAISSARTMWGSCTADGRVRLNFRLLQLAPEVMGHVVAHELAHLVEFNHSKRFWAIVQQLDPNANTHRRIIKNYSVLLEL